MKQYIEIIKDSFVDFLGKTHHFVIAAVSEVLDNTAVVALPEGFLVSSIGSVNKGIKLGISICNPTDEFDEKVGVLKATARAKNAPYTLFASDCGQINTTVVKALLTQEAEYLKSNPDKYIKGYSESKARFMKKNEMEKVKDNFTEVEKAIVVEVEKDPKFLDNVTKYLSWVNNQNKGKKCKQGK